MEEGVGVPHVRPGESDEPGEDPGRGVGGEADEEMPHEAGGLLDPVERGEVVDLLQELVDEGRDLHQVPGAILGDQDVLRAELEYLARLPELVPVGVMGVAQGAEPLDADPRLIGPEVGEGEVDHVVPDGPVLEDEEVVDSSGGSPCPRARPPVPGR